MGHAFGRLRRHIVEVGSFSADDRAETDDRVVPMLAGNLPGDNRHFPRTRDLDYVDQVRIGAGAGQRVHRATEQTLRDEAVEAADDDGEPESSSRG